MNRTLAIGLLAVALPILPANANPASSLQVRDTGMMEAHSSAGNKQSSVVLFYERVATLAPGATTGDIFPITIDPNDPPELPVAVTETRVTISGWAFVCDWDLGGCSDRQIPAGTPAETILTFEDQPMPGNAIAFDTTFQLGGNLGAITLPLSIRATRPSATRLWTDNTVLHPNLWTEGRDAHAGVDLDQPLITRHGYTLTGTIGGKAPTFGYTAFTRQVRAVASAGATLPA